MYRLGKEVLMKVWERLLVGTTLVTFVLLCVICGHCETRKSFLAVTVFHAGSLVVDGLSTSRCYREVGEPWLYGSRPSVQRLSLVMAGEFVVVTGVTYILRKKRFWYVGPLVLSGTHLDGGISNMRTCR